MSKSVQNTSLPSPTKDGTTSFTFCPHKITKLEPYGNIIKDIPCPKPRSGHRIVILDGDIYSFGGYNPDIPDSDEDQVFAEDVLFKEVWRFNYATKTWIYLDISGPMAEEVASHCAVLVDKYMLVYGGTGFPFGSTSSNVTHICDLKSLQWFRPETTGDFPDEMYGQAVVVSSDKMYVVGGTTGFIYSMKVHCLNFANREWENLSADVKWQPEPRYRHEIALYNNKIYVLGGGTSIDYFDLQKIPVFDIEQRCWSYVNTSEECPTPRRCHGCAQMGSDIYICGGLDGDEVFSDFWKLDLETLKWTKFSVTLPTQLYFHAVSLSEAGQLFVFGGVTSIWSNLRINDAYSMWLKIPSLADICWEAILHYVPCISQQKKEKLFEAGIPYRYLDKIEFDESTQESFVVLS